jgi:hypothetical protein
VLRRRPLTHLLKFYSPDHQVSALFCSNYFSMLSEAITMRIADIPSHAHELHAGHTLYIPPEKERETLSFDLARDLADIEHLRTVTRDRYEQDPL